jgi:uncharacterized protein GlcG (DUF336 family)
MRFETKRTVRKLQRTVGAALAVLLVVGCGGGSGGSDRGVDLPPAPCSGSCADASSRLTVADVGTVIAQAVNEANAQNVDRATIAVVDRVGNVLAVFRVGPALSQQVVIASQLDGNGNAVIDGGLEGIRLPVAPLPASARLDDQAAIAKAVTAAYLSSEGNAFSTRTASQIVQEHFNPGEDNQPAPTSRARSTASAPTRGRNARRWACPRIPADCPCTRPGCRWAPWASSPTVSTGSTRTSPTPTATSTR